MRQEKYMSTEVTAHRLKMLMRERNWGVKAFANRIPADKNSVKNLARRTVLPEIRFVGQGVRAFGRLCGLRRGIV